MEMDDSERLRDEAAKSTLNRYYTWLHLGRPDRLVTDDECRKHFKKQSGAYHTHIIDVMLQQKGGHHPE